MTEPTRSPFVVSGVRGRTEIEVAASVIARLLDQQLLRGDPQVLRMAADKVGVTVDQVRDAWRHLRDKGWTSPSRSSVIEEEPATEPEQATITRIGRPPRARPDSPRPEGTKYCRRHGEYHPKDEFLPQRFNPGFVPLVHSCIRAYQESVDDPRCFFTENSAVYRVVKEWLEHRLEHGEAMTCPNCLKPVLRGQRTRVVMVLAHENCGEVAP